MTERRIGSTFDDPNYGKLQVVEGTTSCEGCVYADMEYRIVNCDIIFTGYCHEGFRSDKKNVVFKRIKTIEVGTIFNHPQYGKLEVVERAGCEGCYFRRDYFPCCAKEDFTLLCAPSDRSDDNSVIFKHIDNGEKTDD